AIWDLVSLRLLFNFETRSGISPDYAGGCFDHKNQVFAFATGTNAFLYSLSTGAILQCWPLLEGWSDQLQFDTSGRLLLLRGERAPEHHGIWRLYQLTDQAAPVLLHQQKENSWFPLDMAFPKDGKQFLVRELAKGQSNQVIHGYDTATGQEI